MCLRGLVCGTLRYPGLTSEYISSISTSSFANLSDDELAKRDWFADVCGKGMTAQQKLLEDTRVFFEVPILPILLNLHPLL